MIGAVLSRSAELFQQVGARDYQTVRTAHLLLGHLVDAETGLRGDELAHDQRFLEPYETGRRAAQRELAVLRTELAGNAVQSARVHRIQTLFDRWERDVAVPIVAHEQAPQLGGTVRC